MILEKRSNVISILIGILAIGVVGIGSYYLGSYHSQKNQPSEIAPQKSLSTCQNKMLGVVLSIPSTWKCTLTKNSETDSSLLLHSDFFSITISNGISKEPCISNPYVYGYDTNCRLDTFYSTPSISTALYTYQGKNMEIYGNFINANNTDGTPVPWISIKYKNMENQALSDTQKNELIQILNSLSPYN